MKSEEVDNGRGQEEDEEGEVSVFKLVEEKEQTVSDDDDDIYADVLIAKLQTSGMPIKRFVYFCALFPFL